MSVLVYAETQSGQLKKAALEAVTYGKKTADALQTDCVALVLGSSAQNPGQLGKYGASKVYVVDDAALDQFDAQVYTKVIAEAVQQLGAQVVVLNHSSTGKALIGRLAVRLEAGAVSGASAVPEVNDGFRVRKNVFSGKAFADVAIHTEHKVVSLTTNALAPEEVGAEVSAENLSVEVPAPKVKVTGVDRVEGTVPLPEAEKVVSAGRGMKGPENWEIIEELAETLGATTACSRPVSDTGWRPHHEHVGQTGIAIRPNLYIAIGISGAIQHLAGVNRSKTIVVINKDPDAPFFKAADYGVVGDLFEVVPKLNAALKSFQANQ